MITNKGMRLALLAVGGAMAVLLIVVAITRTPRGDGSRASLHVGVVLPLTGDAAVYGQAIKDGIELAAAHERVAGSTRITLIYEDDQGVPRQAISAVRRLIDVEHVPAIIGGAMSSTAEPIIPVSDQAHVVLLSPTATKPGLPEMSPYFFRLWPSDDYDGKVMAQASYNDLGLRRVAILYINVAYGVGITEVFTREFRALGGTIVSSEGYRQGATDFRTLLTRIASQKPDAIYLPGYVAEIGNILRQARELNIQTRFIGVNSLYDPQLIEVAGG
ncbi:MAG: ABC transporter substrate-binding protein, partial [Acidimicrobiia bacterium]